MGASGSTSASSLSGADEFRQRVNLIAAKFIMTPDFERLGSLSNEKYCGDLLILTRDLLAKKFSTKQINYLAMGNIKKDSILYISRTDLANMESGMRDKKKMMCNGIARFYVRIAHVFAAIISTVSPNWKAGATTNGNSASDFCKVRIDSLLKTAQLVRDENGKNEHVLVQPTVCSLYASESSMMAQPGFPDLDPLYNDIYDFEKGVFNRRSSGMNAKYETDLKALFSVFTGTSNKPDNIKRFSDINIASLAKRIPECGQHVPTAKPAPAPEISKPADQDPRVTEQIEIDRIRKNAEFQDKYMRSSAANMSGSFVSPPKGAFKTNGAYTDYAGHVKTMMHNADRARNSLLKILDKMFLIVTIDSKPKITIHPTLTSDGLDALVNQTRDQIMQLYMGCERDFYQGMKLLRVIVEEKMQENMQAALIKLKADTRVAIKRTIEQKRVDTTTDKPGIFSEIKNAMFNPVPYDVSQAEDKIKKDIDKQSAINKATDDENNAKENLVNINKEIKDISDEIVSLTQMVDVITKKKQQADAELAAAPSSSTLLKKVAEVQTELNEATEKLKEFGVKKEELKTNITAAEKTLNDYTEVKNKLLTSP